MRQTSYESLLLRKLLEELEAKHPLIRDSYSPHDVAKISCCHALEVDYHFRIHWGSRTELASFQNGIIEINAYVSFEVY